VKIVSKTGLNLVGLEIERYGLVLLPSRIGVDGVAHGDEEARFARIDRWVREAKSAPEVMGTPAAEILAALQQTAEEDAEILVVTASHKLASSYDEAVAAAAALKKIPEFARTRVLVLDTGSSDFGGGVPAIFAGEASRAGLSLERVAEVTRAFVEGGTSFFVPRTLDNLVRGGQANFLRAMVASLLGMSPVIGIEDGAMRPVDRVRHGDIQSKILELVRRKVRPGRKVWAAVAHGGNAIEARAIADQIEKDYDAELMLVRPLMPTSYLHLGEDAIACYVAPIDELPWTPPRPAPL
jgi:DegV family protein with EDD domain